MSIFFSVPGDGAFFSLLVFFFLFAVLLPAGVGVGVNVETVGG